MVGAITICKSLPSKSSGLRSSNDAVSYSSLSSSSSFAGGWSSFSAFTIISSYGTVDHDIDLLMPLVATSSNEPDTFKLAPVVAWC